MCGFFYLYYAISISVIIKTPPQVPQDDNWYFIGISCWDENSSYDQIGFNSRESHGNRYSSIIYSSTYWLNNELKFKCTNDGGFLYTNTRYRFTMTLNNGVIYFKIEREVGSSWSIVREVAQITGGNRFVVANTFWTCLGPMADFTNWEEALPDSPAPPFDFKFQETRLDGVAFSWWLNFFAGPVPSGITISYFYDGSRDKPYVLIDNP